MCILPDEREFFLEAMTFWGEEKQTNMLIEEIGELLQAINKYRRNPTKENKDKFVIELADVGLLIEQHEVYLDPVLYRKSRNYKLERTQNKLARQKEMLKNKEETQLYGASFK